MKRSIAMTAALFCAASLNAAEAGQGVPRDLARLAAAALALAGPAAEPAPPAPRIRPGDRAAFMGDSITAAGGYLRLARGVLKQKYPGLELPDFVNAGVNGQKAEDMAARFSAAMKLEEKPAWAFISAGVNDVWHRLKAPHDPAVLAAYKANVAKMADLAMAAGAAPVLLTPTIIEERADSEGNKRLEMYVAAMKEVAAEKKCALVDMHGMFLQALKNKPEGLALTSDGVHMGVYGDAVMAAGVLRAFGVPDSEIASADTLPLVKCRGWNLPVPRLAELLEIPAEKFSRPELERGYSF